MGLEGGAERVEDVGDFVEEDAEGEVGGIDDDGGGASVGGGEVFDAGIGVPVVVVVVVGGGRGRGEEDQVGDVLAEADGDLGHGLGKEVSLEWAEGRDGGLTSRMSSHGQSE